MVYYKDEELLIRTMEESDAPLLVDEFHAQGWNKDIDGFMIRFKEQAEGMCIPLVALYRGQLAGYVYLYLDANEGPFKGKGWPIIVDFNVLMKYQRKGIGNRIMDVAEQIAAQYADTVCLSVGLSREYGTAQRMYAKRGYIPDGSGVWYQDKQCVQYKTVCTVDDDLVLYMAKELKRAR